MAFLRRQHVGRFKEVIVRDGYIFDQLPWCYVFDMIADFSQQEFPPRPVTFDDLRLWSLVHHSFVLCIFGFGCGEFGRQLVIVGLEGFDLCFELFFLIETYLFAKENQGFLSASAKFLD